MMLALEARKWEEAAARSSTTVGRLYLGIESGLSINLHEFKRARERQRKIKALQHSESSLRKRIRLIGFDGIRFHFYSFIQTLRQGDNDNIADQCSFLISHDGAA